MARAPYAKVSLTSGQGVSRLSYQKGRALARSGDAPQVKGKFTGPDLEYGKGKSGSSQKTSMNVSYGDTYGPTDLNDITAMSALKPAKSGVPNKPGRTKKLVK